jgi:hypothetical protein
VRSAAPQSAESAAVDSARARVRLSYKLPDGLKPYTGSTLLPKAQVDAVRANRTPSSELPASVAASAASEILKRAEREGQEAAMDIRKRLVKPVFEDRAFRGDMGPADLNEQQAQQLFDEMCACDSLGFLCVVEDRDLFFFFCFLFFFSYQCPHP